MDAAQIQQVRRFNRLVTQRVGALEESYLRRGRPLGEARLIFEAGGDGVDVRRLRHRLGLDSGYLSRMLRSLEGQGLVAVETPDADRPADRRLRHVRLTEAGRTELAAYETSSDELAVSILAALNEEQRTRLVRAMAEVERLLRAASVTVTVEDPRGADARWCLGEYFRELAQRFETGFDPGKSNPASAAEMTPPAGYFVLARIESEPVGCGALKCMAPGMGEIKRMWTSRTARGLGVARAVLRKLEAIAREAGLTMLRLETNRTLTEAKALYRGEGYSEVPRFNDEPYAHHWFEKRI